jgi:transposase
MGFLLGLGFSRATICASVSTRPSWALLASSAFGRLFIVSRSWRSHTQRTPAGDTFKMATEGVAMGRAIAVRTDYTAGEVRRLAKRATDAAQAWRLLAIAAVLDGGSRSEAAKIGGMDRQTLRDWVIRFNDQGLDGLINIPSPGVPPKLDVTHRAFLGRIVEEGPIPAVHGVVRWRACDLIMRLHEEFGRGALGKT